MARGDAVATEGTREIKADALTAFFEPGRGGALEAVRMDAVGNVVITTPREVARGNEDVYNVKKGVATLSGDAGQILLTPEGWQRACEIVRNHRLWELYLTNEADYEADHVHADAEKVEHILNEEQVMQLERYLDYPEEDPHGKRIPSLRDTQRLPLRDLAGKGESEE